MVCLCIAAGISAGLAREEMADFYFFVASQELKKEHVA